MQFYKLLLCLFFITSCDTRQAADGIVLDSETKKAIDSVALGKFETEDSANPFSSRVYTDSKGKFEYRRVGGTINFTLYFSKEGYETKEVKIEKSNSFDDDYDTVYLRRIK